MIILVIFVDKNNEVIIMNGGSLEDDVVSQPVAALIVTYASILLFLHFTGIF